MLRTVAPDLCTAPTDGSSSSQQPATGRSALGAEQVKKVEAELVHNPPQRFDLARTLNVFNAYVEFIELRLTGMQIARHTVRLPQDLILALRDEATTRRLRTSFNLVDGGSKVGRDAESVETRVRHLRDRLILHVGDLGTIALRSKHKEVDALMRSVAGAIAQATHK